MKSTEEIIDLIDEVLERPVIGCPTIHSPNQKVLEDFNKPKPFSQGTIFGEWLGTVPEGFGTVPEGFSSTAIIISNGFHFPSVRVLYGENIESIIADENPPEDETE